MKKVTVVLLCFIIIFSFSGCSSKANFEKIEKGCEISGNVFENKDMGIRITVPSGEFFYTTSEIENEVYNSSNVEDDIYKKAKDGSFIFAYSSGMANSSDHYLCAMALKDKKSAEDFFKGYDETYSTVKDVTVESDSSKEKIGNIDFEKRVYSMKTGNLDITTTIYYGFYDGMAINISYLGDGVVVESIK